MAVDQVLEFGVVTADIKLIKNKMDLEFSMNGTESFRSFYDYFVQRKSSANFFGDNALVGSRLIPETVVRKQPDQVADVLFRIRGRSESHTILAGHILYTQGWPRGTAAVDEELMASRLRAQIEILQTMAGDAQSSCYLNEADPNEPNWEQKFIGTKVIYDRLKSIKNSVDPNSLFICKTCVGSDEWSADLSCPKTSSAARIHVSITLLTLIKLF